MDMWGGTLCLSGLQLPAHSHKLPSLDGSRRVTTDMSLWLYNAKRWHQSHTIKLYLKWNLALRACWRKCLRPCELIMQSVSDNWGGLLSPYPVQTGFVATKHIAMMKHRDPRALLSSLLQPCSPPPGRHPRFPLLTMHSCGFMSSTVSSTAR